MYYRRKIILSLLEKFGGALPKTDFQKLLFLFSQEHKQFFDFVPYKFGCFSFQAQQDVSTMIKYGLINESEKGWKNISSESYIKELKPEDRFNLNSFFHKYKELKGQPLIRYVYSNFPYYAINSEMLQELFDGKTIARILDKKPKNNIKALYTIGYEGKSVEEYANILLKNDIKILIDVRKNPKSMKFGFSKKQLENVMKNVGIDYKHIPELGIESQKRISLDSYEDYVKLFSEYRRDNIPANEMYLQNIDVIIDKCQRAALTCFEADPKYCHRHVVAEEVKKRQLTKYDIIHL